MAAEDRPDAGDAARPRKSSRSASQGITESVTGGGEAIGGSRLRQLLAPSFSARVASVLLNVSRKPWSRSGGSRRWPVKIGSREVVRCWGGIALTTSEGL